MSFIEELKWRGMLNDSMPGTEELLKSEQVTAYIGFDPTADSLHIGSLAQIMTLRLFQQAGHKPLALVGGATGMIGDPSGKSKERNLLNEHQLNENLNGIKAQLEKFLDFDASNPNAAQIVNNYDWMKNFSFLEFIRDIGKHLTVNYMMAKDSVKKRIDAKDAEADVQGMSFTEFSYQLVQGYDFLWLFDNMNCKLQMGGSDQWGNITTGTELIRRKSGGKAYALTTNLITKADGGKFGKTEKGNVWLDPEKTSPYEFYQFWMNTSDNDAEKFIKIFTQLSQSEIQDLAAQHQEEPHRRILQKRLAREITVLVHGQKEYDAAVAASQILFGNGTKEQLLQLDEKTLLSVFSGVPQFEVDKLLLNDGVNILELICSQTAVFASKGEARRLMKDNGLSINQIKETDPEKIISTDDLLQQKYMLVRKGKKNYFLIIAR